VRDRERKKEGNMEGKKERQDSFEKCAENKPL
jgi:hypothetical protein